MIYDLPEGTRLCGMCEGATLIFNAKINPLAFIQCPACKGAGVIVAWGLLEEKLRELLSNE